MVRQYDTKRSVPPDAVDALVSNALRAPSAGFSQGWGFPVLDEPADIGRFRSLVTPAHDADGWFAATFDAPLVIVPCSSKDAYLDRYRAARQGFTDRSDVWWPAPYWDIDTGFATLLILLPAVDRGLGACFFGFPIECFAAFREAFGVPADFRPIGACTIGYPDEPPRDLRDRRRPQDEIVHSGRWRPTP
jgi:nitroreductase